MCDTHIHKCSPATFCRSCLTTVGKESGLPRVPIPVRQFFAAALPVYEMSEQRVTFNGDTRVLYRQAVRTPLPNEDAERLFHENMPEVSTFLWPLSATRRLRSSLMTLSAATLLPNLGRRSPTHRQPTARVPPHARVRLARQVRRLDGRRAQPPPRPLRPGSVGVLGHHLTHLGFVAEGLLVPHYARTTKGALVTALVLALANDVLDYGFGYHPPLRYDPGVVLPLATVALRCYRWDRLAAAADASAE